jgi:ribosomal protein L32
MYRSQRRPRCLVCAASSGQLAPFCEWCGARHAKHNGRLILTGAICQHCGFQSRLPFALCPRCQAPSAVICPRCGAEVRVRQSCARCGLHYAFFDRMRAHGGHQPRSGARKIAFAAGILALATTLAPGHNPRNAALFAALAFVTMVPAALGGRPRIAGGRATRARQARGVHVIAFPREHGLTRASVSPISRPATGKHLTLIPPRPSNSQGGSS